MSILQRRKFIALPGLSKGFKTSPKVKTKMRFDFWGCEHLRDRDCVLFIAVPLMLGKSQFYDG